MSTPCHPRAPQGFCVIFFILQKFARGISSETKSAVVYHLLSLFSDHYKILHEHCLQFLLGVKMASRETVHNAYAKFCGDKQRELWYVMVFSVVVSYWQTTHLLVLFIL